MCENLVQCVINGTCIRVNLLSKLWSNYNFFCADWTTPMPLSFKKTEIVERRFKWAMLSGMP